MTAACTQLPRTPHGVRIDDVFITAPGAPRLYAGHDASGQGWLVALKCDHFDARHWVCAPASDRAISCVRSGRARPADLFRHSATGFVELITAHADGRTSESIRLCADLDESDLPLDLVPAA
jgi:hypothetical protein